MLFFTHSALTKIYNISSPPQFLFSLLWWQSCLKLSQFFQFYNTIVRQVTGSKTILGQEQSLWIPFIKIICLAVNRHWNCLYMQLMFWGTLVCYIICQPQSKYWVWVTNDRSQENIQLRTWNTLVTYALLLWSQSRQS